MNERIPSDPDLGGSSELPKLPPALGRVSASRRQFAKAGAAAPVVLGSLLSKPALAAQPYNCTISGQISGNTSPHAGAATCKTLGLPPETWKTSTAWPTGAVRGGLPNNGCNFTGGVAKGTVFSGFAAGGNTVIDTFHYGSGGGACNIYGFGDSNFAATVANKASMLQILNTTSSALLFQLGRATVATILNALNKGADYPVSAGQAIKMFNAVYQGGSYVVNGTVSWDGNKVLAYFQSLYQ